MTSREDALSYGLSFKNTYQDAPFHDPNWQLVRVKGSKKAFLWTYERDGYINLNVKVSAESRDFWRSVYESVIPGWHQNKEHWNTIILDGSIPDKDIKTMIAESYDIVSDSPSKRIYEAVKKYRRERLQHMDRWLYLQAMKRWQELWEMRCIRIRNRELYHVIG